MSINREQFYRSRDSANRMEAVMLLVSVIGIIGTVFALLRTAWLTSLELLILSSLAYGLSRLFDLCGDLLVSIGKPNSLYPSEKPEDA